MHCLCHAFAMPVPCLCQVRQGGAHGLSSALWSLGCVLHLLLTGTPYTPLEAEKQPEAHPEAKARAAAPRRAAMPRGQGGAPPEGEALWGSVSAEARAVVASLVRPDPAARLGLDDLLSLPWVDCAEPLPSSLRPSPARPSPPASPALTAAAGELGRSGRLLVEAHEALNVWHDGFLFDGVCDALAQMAETEA